MDISIVIPTLNGGSRLIECAKSLTNQKIEKLFEIVLIDSGSHDGSLEKFALIIKEACLPLSVIKIEKSDFQHGATRNHAIESTSGEIICLITQDAVPDNENWLFELTEVFKNNLDLAGVFGRHKKHNDHPSLLGKDLDLHFKNMAHLLVRKIDDYELYEKNERIRQNLHFFSNNNSAIRKSVWQKHPLPAVDFGEDQTWAKLVLENGFSLLYQPRAIVRHSHLFTLKEIYDRTLIEISFFRDQFQYDLKQKPINFIPNVIKGIKYDFVWLLKNKSWTIANTFCSLRKNLGLNFARTRFLKD
jgi:rhamnosyltransferase